MAKLDPQFVEKIEKLGAFDVTACYSCGTCTAICPLSTNEHTFPRRMIRYSLLGLEENILKSPDPWLCYYCGECTESCPRDADPGGLMMALRRYATRKYSLGRIADLFYGGFSSLAAWIVLTLVATLGIIIFHNPTPNLVSVDPLSFISLSFLHDAGIVLAVYIFFFAIVQLYLMARGISGQIPRGSPLIWTKEFFITLWDQVFIQKRFNDCEKKNRYIPHLALFWGFSGLFLSTIIAFGVDFFGFPGNLRILAKVIGVISGLVLLYGSGYFIYRRFIANDTYSAYSHHSDWVFVSLLFLAGLTGFILDIFMWTNLPRPGYIIFSVHLVIVFDLLVTAPFTKFAHAIYRPLAIWLSETWDKAALEEKAKVSA